MTRATPFNAGEPRIAIGRQGHVGARGRRGIPDLVREWTSDRKLRDRLCSRSGQEDCLRKRDNNTFLPPQPTFNQLKSLSALTHSTQLALTPAYSPCVQREATESQTLALTVKRWFSLRSTSGNAFSHRASREANCPKKFCSSSNHLALRGPIQKRTPNRRPTLEH